MYLALSRQPKVPSMDSSSHAGVEAGSQLRGALPWEQNNRRIVRRAAAAIDD